MEPQTSKAELANTFGDLQEIAKPANQYAQFRFDNIKVLTPVQLMPIYNLLLSYEQRHGLLRFKMFHLYDDNDNTHSPISLQACKGVWAVINSATGIEMNSGVNLLTLL